MTSYGFTPGPGTDFKHGKEPELAARLDALARKLKIQIVGISGYRTPAHSVAVGGFANDPHTRGESADVGVNGSLRASAAVLTTKDLASVGLVRPYAGAAEINHFELAPGSEHPTNGENHGGGLVDSAKGLGKKALLTPGGVVGIPLFEGAKAAAGAAEDAAKAAADPAAGLATSVAKKLGEVALDTLGERGARWGLTAVFVLAGAWLLTAGLQRAVGVDIAAPVKAAGKAASRAPVVIPA